MLSSSDFASSQINVLMLCSASEAYPRWCSHDEVVCRVSSGSTWRARDTAPWEGGGEGAWGGMGGFHCSFWLQGLIRRRPFCTINMLISFLVKHASSIPCTFSIHADAQKPRVANSWLMSSGADSSRTNMLKRRRNLTTTGHWQDCGCSPRPRTTKTDISNFRPGLRTHLLLCLCCAGQACEMSLIKTRQRRTGPIAGHSEPLTPSSWEQPTSSDRNSACGDLLSFGDWPPASWG